MAYAIRWDANARETLRKLERVDAQRIIKKVDEARLNPHHFLEPLTELQGYRLRAGDYRVIIDIDDKQQLLQVRLVGHRKNVYKEMNR